MTAKGTTVVKVHWAALAFNATAWSDGNHSGPGIDGFGRHFPASQLPVGLAQAWPWPPQCGSGIKDHITCVGQRVDLPSLAHGSGDLEIVGWSTGGSAHDEIACIDAADHVVKAPFGLTDFLASCPAHGNEARLRCDRLWEQGVLRNGVAATVWTWHVPLAAPPAAVQVPFVPMLAIAALGWRPAR